jgi:5-(carboxyamino)imidazole ribonucleotide synthase
VTLMTTAGQIPGADGGERSALPAARSPLPPGSWLAVIGGGQLGRMFCMAAQSLGYRVCVLDPAESSPAGAVADCHLHAGYGDRAALAKIADRCQAATTEFENVPATALAALAERIRVHPSAAAVAVAQDRIVEKRFIAAAGVAVAPHAPVRTIAEARAVDRSLLPGILKVARLGYDGKGQVTVESADDVVAAFGRFGAVPAVLERRLGLAAELSVLVARAADGAIVHYPVGRNWHRDGILAMTRVPSGLEPAVEQHAIAAARAIARALDYVGVLCVEFFLLGDGAVVANEIAPRPHNSGHYSLDASVTSQFEQQVRLLAGLPPGSTDSLTPAIMLNILGDAWFEAGADGRDQRREPDWARLLAHPRARLHLYGKDDPRRGRKMGHLTLVGAPVATLEDDARLLAPLIAQVPLR